MRQYLALNIDRTGSADQLPIEIVTRRPTSSRIMPFVFLAFGVVAAVILLRSLPASGTGDSGLFVPIAIGGAVLLATARPLVGMLRGGGPSGATYRIDSDTVTCTPEGRGEGWSEPLSNYRGVKWETFIQQRRNSGSSRNRPPMTHHVLSLAHADPKRSVPLFRSLAGQVGAGDAISLLARSLKASRDPEGDHEAVLEAETERLQRQASGDAPREHWEAFARTLDLPAIDARQGGEQIREAGDLDKSVKELAAEGKVSAELSDGPPPEALEVVSDGEGDEEALTVAFRAPSAPAALVILAGAGVLFLVIGIFSLSIGSLFGAVLFLGAAWGVRELERRNPRRLRLTRSEMSYTNPLRAREGFTLPLAEVESVAVRAAGGATVSGQRMNLSGQVLVLSTDAAEHKVGQGLPPEALDWLRDYVTSAIATA